MAFKRFIRVAANGTVLEDRLGRQRPAGDWIEVPPAQHHMLGLEPHRIRWVEGKGLTEKPRIRLTTGAFSWPADGVSAVAIGVRGEALVSGARVTVQVNQDTYQIARDDDIMLTSDQPGQYRVRVIDPYFYAVPAEIILTAEEVSDA